MSHHSIKRREEKKKKECDVHVIQQPLCSPLLVILSFFLSFLFYSNLQITQKNQPF